MEIYSLSSSKRALNSRGKKNLQQRTDESEIQEVNHPKSNSTLPVYSNCFESYNLNMGVNWEIV